MRVAHYLIRGRSGLFYFRLRVPRDLCAVVGVRVVKRATGTRCPRTALAAAVDWAARYARAFIALRQGDVMAKPPKIEDIVGNFQRGEARPYSLERTPDGGFRLTATDAADHGRAMEALDKIGMVLPFVPSTAPPLPKTRGITLAEAARKWQTAILSKNKNEKTRKAKKKAVDDFADWKQSTLAPKAAPVRLDTLTRTDLSEWFIALQGQAGLIASTIENKFNYVAGFFDWAMASGHYPQGANPARGHANVPKKIKRARAKSHGWQAFTPQQLAAIFTPADYASMESEAARWLPLLALYTGARSNELAHLELDDCYIDADGMEVLDFNLLGEHKSLKTEASERKTPVHPDLIALGLWERVARLKLSGEIKLFPELTFTAQNGPANGPQRAFSRYLTRLNIAARGGGKIGHHSFRDTVIDKMKTAGVPRELREEYTGHELSDRQEHAHAYELDFSPDGLAKACHPALTYGLDLKGLSALLR